MNFDDKMQELQNEMGAGNIPRVRELLQMYATCHLEHLEHLTRTRKSVATQTDDIKTSKRINIQLDMQEEGMRVINVDMRIRRPR